MDDYSNYSVDANTAVYENGWPTPQHASPAEPICKASRGKCLTGYTPVDYHTPAQTQQEQTTEKPARGDANRKYQELLNQHIEPSDAARAVARGESDEPLVVTIKNGRWVNAEKVHK